MKKNVVIQTIEDLRFALEWLAKHNTVYFDTETDGLSHDRAIIGFSLSAAGRGWYVPIAALTPWDETFPEKFVPLWFDVADICGYDGFSIEGKDRLKALQAKNNLESHELPSKKLCCQEPDNVPFEMWSQIFDALFFAPERLVWMHNAKFDVHNLRRYGYDPAKITCKIRDSMVLVHLLHPEWRKGLKPLVLQHLGIEMTTYDSFARFGKRADWVPTSDMAPYATDDVVLLERLVVEGLLPLLAKDPKQAALSAKLFEDLEMPFVLVLEDMENEGFLLDQAYLHRIHVDMGGEVEGLVDSIGEACGVPRKMLKLGSTQWLSKTFIDDLGWWPALGGRGKNGHFSTKAGHLQLWANGVSGTNIMGKKVAELLLRKRRVDKLRSTYTTALIDRCDDGGRLHASFNHTGTATGRLSSSGPNLQNIPRPSDDLPNIRRAFIPREGFVIMGVDYSQIELRLMAHFSRDPMMTKAYMEGHDIHQMTADACGCSRQHAKGVNFGLLYGMGPGTLAGTIGVTEQQARRYRGAYFDTYYGVAAYQKTCAAQARRLGYTTTIIGRRRYLPGIQSDEWQVRGPAERQAINTRVQGSAADLIKIGMRNIRQGFQDKGWFRQHAFMISQVHDELLFEVRIGYEEEVGALVRHELETALPLRVPLIAVPSFGETWSEAK